LNAKKKGSSGHHVREAPKTPHQMDKLSQGSGSFAAGTGPFGEKRKWRRLKRSRDCLKRNVQIKETGNHASTEVLEALQCRNPGGSDPPREEAPYIRETFLECASRVKKYETLRK